MNKVTLAHLSTLLGFIIPGMEWLAPKLVRRASKLPDGDQLTAINELNRFQNIWMTIKLVFIMTLIFLATQRPNTESNSDKTAPSESKHEFSLPGETNEPPEVVEKPKTAIEQFRENQQMRKDLSLHTEVWRDYSKWLNPEYLLRILIASAAYMTLWLISMLWNVMNFLLVLSGRTPIYFLKNKKG